MNKNKRNNSENESESSPKKPKIDNGYETPTDKKIKLGKTPPYIKRRGLVPNSLQNNDDSNLEFP